jgi:hypothetical protein
MAALCHPHGLPHPQPPHVTERCEREGFSQRLCKDHDEQCAAWAAVPGECERNRDFMWARCQV